MSKYEPDELDALMARCIDLLGHDVFSRVVDAPPRWSGFVQGLEAAIKANDGSPTKVTDTQIEWALEVALEIWPFDAEAVANAYFAKH